MSNKYIFIQFLELTKSSGACKLTFDYLSFNPEDIHKSSSPIRNKDECNQYCSSYLECKSYVYYSKGYACTCLTREINQLFELKMFDKLGASKKCQIKPDRCVSISG